MTCWAIAQLLAACLGLNHMPERGEVVTVTRRCERRLSFVRRKAERCAAEHGIRWRIVGG